MPALQGACPCYGEVLHSLTNLVILRVFVIHSVLLSLIKLLCYTWSVFTISRLKRL